MKFDLFEQKMRRKGLPDLAIEAFARHYRQLVAGQAGKIGEDRLDLNYAVPDLETQLDYSEVGRKALGRTVVIKLNGGLGTGMGLDRAKSLLPVKEGRSFLDVIVGHILYLREQYGVNLPLLLMNSFRTEADTLAALARYPELTVAGLPVSFVQHQVPKVDQASLGPVEWPPNPELEWCPPGHGDIYTALVTSGCLQTLLNQGYEYAYASNADNMGSMMDVRVLGYFARSGAPFMMEVADRTPVDRKGGHLARYRERGWMLREVAHCPADEVGRFQDIARFRHFNTNNIWWHLPSLWRTLEEQGFIFDLPLIVNRKTVDPAQPGSPPVYQLETAIGSAIEVFPDAAVLRVPRTRQIAIKHWSDLLVLWSDAFVTASDGRIILNPACRGRPPDLQLDPRFYRTAEDIARRFPAGVPSLVNCDSIRIEGDFFFGKDVAVEGDISLLNMNPKPIYIPDNSRLSGNLEF